jgi:hypothetical protein
MQVLPAPFEKTQDSQDSERSEECHRPLDLKAGIQGHHYAHCGDHSNYEVEGVPTISEEDTRSLCYNLDGSLSHEDRGEYIVYRLQDQNNLLALLVPFEHQEKSV